MTIYTWANYIHSILRWFILFFILIAILRSLRGFSFNQPFTTTDKKISTLLLIVTHTTVLIGIYQWIVGSWGLKNIQNLGLSVVMKDAVARFWAIEHITCMLFAAILITMGKRATKLTIADRTKHKRTFWFYVIALVLILIAIPWPFRESLGRQWFPNM